MVQAIIATYKISLLFAIIGIFLISLAVVISLNITGNDKRNDIQFKEAGEEAVYENVIVVDIQGAIVNPGLYEIDSQVRIGDLISLAGGFTDKADYTWVSKQLNQAQIAKDGMKLYIPSINDIVSEEASYIQSTVNINTSSRKELESLSGIGEKRAQDIVDGRPYSIVEELVDRDVISQSIFESIRSEISTY